MVLHLGADTMIPKREIIGIFDLENTSISPRTRDFLTKAQRKHEVVNVSIEELPKSFVVCRTDAGQRVYISPIAPSTLRRRAMAKL